MSSMGNHSSKDVAVKKTAIVKVVGSLNWDIINRLQYLDGFGIHGVYIDDMDVQHPGGHGVNQAVGVYRSSHAPPLHSETEDSSSQAEISQNDFPFEVEVHLIGAIGDQDGDKRGVTIIQELRENNINVDGIQTMPTKTGYAHIDIDEAGRSSIRTKFLANNYLSWEDHVKEQLDNEKPADLIIVSLEIPLETVRETIKFAKQKQIQIIFNPAPYHTHTTTVFGNQLQSMNLYDDQEIFQVDHLILNTECADGICRANQLDEDRSLENLRTAGQIQAYYMPVCDYFHELGARCVVITVGDRGVIASYKQPKDAKNREAQVTFYLPAKRKDEVEDETGASDAFIGAYAAEILRQIIEKRAAGGTSLNIYTALEMGLKAGGLTTQSVGSLRSIPWRSELLDDEGWFTPHEWRYEHTL